MKTYSVLCTSRFLPKLAFSFLIITSLCCATPSENFSTQNTSQNLDQEIEFLEKELEDLRHKALNSEIHAQPYMIDNWHQFAENIRLAEDNEKKIVKIKKRIKNIKEFKKTKNSHPNPIYLNDPKQFP